MYTGLLRYPFREDSEWQGIVLADCFFPVLKPFLGRSRFQPVYDGVLVGRVIKRDHCIRTLELELNSHITVLRKE